MRCCAPHRTRIGGPSIRAGGESSAQPARSPDPKGGRIDPADISLSRVAIVEQTHIGFPPLTVAVFVGLALAALLLDMVSHRDNKPISLAGAAGWSIFWVAISLSFAGFLYVQHGSQVASLFLTGYALEKVLSVDNLFVFIAIFACVNFNAWLILTRVTHNLVNKGRQSVDCLNRPPRHFTAFAD